LRVAAIELVVVVQILVSRMRRRDAGLLSRDLKRPLGALVDLEALIHVVKHVRVVVG
jgi:hypothetical protein